MTQGRIFLSYRRADSMGFAHAIHTLLEAHFGDGQVFMDVDTIQPGRDFEDVLDESLVRCDILLLLIGPIWTSVANENGVRRILDPEDYVYMEVKTALDRGVTVIPVLVQGAKMPTETELPDGIKSLAKIQAFTIGDHLKADVKGLIVDMDRVLAEVERKRKAERVAQRAAQQKQQMERLTNRARKPSTLAGFFSLAVIVVFGILFANGSIAHLFQHATPTPTLTPAPSPSSAPVENISQPTVAPSPTPIVFHSGDPSTFTYHESGVIDATFDPIHCTGLPCFEALSNVYEGLVGYKGSDPSTYIPVLAENLPNTADGSLSSDGLTYTFKIRQGVTFHQGGELTADDVAYSFWRYLLTGTSWGKPQLLYFLTGSDDSELYQVLTADLESGARAEALAGATSEKLVQYCEDVKNLVTVDSQAGTVIIHLAAPAPLISLLANELPWHLISDREWVVAHGAWGGSCSDWQDYALSSEATEVDRLANGTGPYRLDTWSSEENQVILTRFDPYWRTEPAWEGGPSGPAAIEKIVIQYYDASDATINLDEFGHYDKFAVSPADYSRVDTQVGEIYRWDNKTGSFVLRPLADYQAEGDPTAPLRVYVGEPAGARSAIVFNTLIDVGSTPDESYIGSGKLDGKGIPRDFFEDINVRKAFTYCMDLDTMIDEGYDGQAVNDGNFILPGMPGYAADTSYFTFDLEKCAEAFKASTLKGVGGASLWDTGFTIRLPYRINNPEMRAAMNILATNISSVNSKFTVTAMSLGVDEFNRQAFSLRTIFPLRFIKWNGDFYDPHNWYNDIYLLYAELVGHIPADQSTVWKTLIDDAIHRTDRSERDAIYRDLNQIMAEDFYIIPMPLPQIREYEQRWVDGWIFNPGLVGRVKFYGVSKQ